MAVIEILAKAINIAILVFLVSTMFSVGLSLTLRQIFEPLRNTRLLVSSLAVSYILVPLVAFVLTRLFPLEAPLKVGLVLFSLAAGSETGPKLVGMAKANVGFSVGLLIAQLGITVLLLPFLLTLLFPEVHINTGKLFIKLLLGVLLPISLGLYLKARYEAMADRLSPYAHRISNVFLVLMTAGLTILNIKEVVLLAGSGAVLAALVFIISSFLIGYLAGGPGQGNRRTLGFMSGARNVGICLVITGQVFSDPKVLLMVITTALLMLILFLPAAVYFGHRTAQQEAEGR
jgi:bile acid:Na+ symporter, BASS family